MGKVTVTLRSHTWYKCKRTVAYPMKQATWNVIFYITLYLITSLKKYINQIAWDFSKACLKNGSLETSSESHLQTVTDDFICYAKIVSKKEIKNKQRNKQFNKISNFILEEFVFDDSYNRILIFLPYFCRRKSTALCDHFNVPGQKQSQKK